MGRELSVVIMAAGKGTRMLNPNMAKVMYEINGRPMIDHVVDLALQMNSRHTIVIVGWQKDSVIHHLATRANKVTCVEQNPQLGTGHAVMQAEAALRNFDGDVLVLSGDVPLLRLETLKRLHQFHTTQHAAATVLTAIVSDAAGYGRIVRDNRGEVVAIVEHKDATPEQQAVKEINSGIYVFDRVRLFEGLKGLTPDNAQKEYYLTDVFNYFWRAKFKVCAVPAQDVREVQGINTLQQLEDMRAAVASAPG